MATLAQKTIDEYLKGRQIEQKQKEKVILAITHFVYERNQNVIKAEAEQDSHKKEQFLRGIEEYDVMIDGKIEEILAGKKTETYDF